MRLKTARKVSSGALWSVLARKLAGAERVLVVLDFDGTLAPLAPRPEAARMSPRTRKVLTRLNGHPRMHVAVISGRSLANVKERVDVSSLTYGGSHGMEMRGPGLSFQHPKAFLLRPVLRKLEKACRRALAGVKGVRVESKPLGVAVHFRQAGPGAVPGLGLLRGLSRGLPVRWRRGLEVWEALPRVDWDKGKALHLLRRHLKDPFPIVIGDDHTDEDMFDAVGGAGICVRVAPFGRTKALYALASQAEVPSFLEKLYRLMAGGPRV